MANIKYMPESKTYLTSTSSEHERMNELFRAIENKNTCYGIVKYCPKGADYLLVDLGFGITGWIPKCWISISRKFTVAHNLPASSEDLNRTVISFKVEGYTENKGFILNRVAVQKEAQQWQHENFKAGDILKVRVISICERGIIVDIGSGVEAFIPPHKLTKSFIKDFETVFKINTEINVLIEHFDEEFDNWSLNYIDCPQCGGLSINSTYAVTLEKKKEANSWYCNFISKKIKGYVVIKGYNDNKPGDVEKATIVAFVKGVPLLKAI